MVKEFGCSLSRYFDWLQAIGWDFMSSEGLTCGGDGGKYPLQSSLLTGLTSLPHGPLRDKTASWHCNWVFPSCEQFGRGQERVHAKMESMIF